MSTSRSTRIYVHFPSTGEVYEENVNYKETISQLITRMLNSSNINNPDAFHFYAINKKCQSFKPDESCSSLFGICCDQLVLTRSELVNVDLFFENRHYNVIYDKSTPALNFLENSLRILQTSSTKFRPPLTKDDLNNYHFALYDPIADIIIHSNLPLNTTFVVLKRFEYIAPGYVFDFSIIKDITPKLSNCSYENAVISNFIKQFRSYHRNEHLSGIEIVEFTEKRSQYLFDSFRNKQFDKSGVSISEQVNFLFSILSLSNQPYIPSSLREMALRAMELEDDRKIFNVARAIAIYMPLSTYLVLQEIFQFFGVATIDESSWNTVSLMLTELLFETKSEDKEENYTEKIFDQNQEKHKYQDQNEKEERESEVLIKFTRFMFLYFKQIFHLNESIGRRNSIRMIKKVSKSDSKTSQKGKSKKSKKKKEKTSSPENQNNDEYGNLFDWVVDDTNAQKREKKKREKKNPEEKHNKDKYRNLLDLVDDDSETSEEVQNDDENSDQYMANVERSKSDRIQKKIYDDDILNTQSDVEKDDKSSKSERKSDFKSKKSDSKIESKSDNENIVLRKDLSVNTDCKTESRSANEDLSSQKLIISDHEDIPENDKYNYSFILYEEMKSREMITRTIDGFVDINLDETVEFVPSESVIDLLDSLAERDDEIIKSQDISNELNELNTLISSIKTKISSFGFVNQSLSQSPKIKRKPTLDC